VGRERKPKAALPFSLGPASSFGHKDHDAAHDDAHQIGQSARAELGIGRLGVFPHSIDREAEFFR